MAASCIYCGTTNDLNTELLLSFDEGKKITVYVCDSHAEDASVKTAKAAYAERQKKIEDFKIMAASLGLEINEPTNGSKIATAKIVAPPPQAHHQTQEAPTRINDSDMLDSAIVDAKTARPIISSGGSVPGFGAVEGHHSHNLDKIKKEVPNDILKGKVKLEAIQGRDGIPVAIATRRIDGLGTTTVKVVDSGGDQALQKRFKNMADGTKRGDHDGFGPHGQGYENQTRICPVCNGNQKVKSRNQVIDCPKCGGDGEIVV